MNKTKTIAIALVGLAIFTGVIIWLGAGHILHAIVKVGWLGLAEIVAWQLFVFIILGVAWWTVTPKASLPTVVWGRLVREGGETCLPFSEVGGLIFGARAVMLSGLDFTTAAASSIVDVSTEAMGMVPFVLIGLLLLMARKPGSSLLIPMIGVIALLVAGAVALYLLRAKLAGLLRNQLPRMVKKWVKDAPDQAEALEHKIEDLYSRTPRIAAGAFVHFVAWCGGGGNVWIAYHLLGAHPSIIDALAIESILSGVLAVAFLIPAGIGVQELTYVGVGKLFGIPGHISLALSLVRRARDIIIGAPSLLIWQAREAKQLKKD
ncbi:MAG: hypothetical protein B7Z80_17940 [Rhodospirillales bacterium 20-64-7]|nr:MAG: hypothetical protein B7Z80_17940 [Rhodospirillales bacterium 20-64-7]